MTTFPLDNTDYLAQDLRLFHAGRTIGIMNVTGSDFEVSASSGMNVKVKNGVAFLKTKQDEFGGVVFSPRQDVDLTVDVAEYYTRYDYIAIRYTLSSNTCSVMYVKGNAETPTPIRNQTVFELIVAIITVRANAGSITNDMIHDVRMDEQYCGLTVDTLLKIPTQSFQNEFSAFMDDIRGSMEGDVALNLQKQIDEMKIEQHNFMKG